MATIYKLRRKNFTLYDETDSLKRMKDSDILAQTKRKTSDPKAAMRSAGYGALTGMGIGAGIGTALGGLATGSLGKRATTSIISGMGRGLGTGLKWGGFAGMGIGVYNHIRKNKDQYNENRQYNQRLEYAQRQAKRRERADWKINMTQRDGYSY